MHILPTLISVIFFVICALVAFFAFYVLQLATREKHNRTYFFLCLCTLVWAFGFSIANTTQSMDTCIIFLRIALLGGVFSYSVFLHYILESNNASVLKKPWIYPALYGSGVIGIAMCPLYSLPDFSPFSLLSTHFGYLPAGVFHVWDWFYIVYQFLASLLCALLLFRYSKNASSRFGLPLKTLLHLFVWSTLLSMGLYISINIVFSLKLAQLTMAPLLCCVTYLFFCVRKYGWMHANENTADQLILTEHMYTRLYESLALMYVAGALLYFLTQYLRHRAIVWEAVLPFSLLLLCFGAIIGLLSKLRMQKHTKNNLILTTICISIPVITLHFAHNGALGIWVFPFFLLLISLLMESRSGLIFLTVSALASQMVLWVLAPLRTVVINDSTYVIRMGFLVFGCGIALFIHKIYVLRLRQSKAQVRLQQLFFELSSDLVSSGLYNIQPKIENALMQLGLFFEVPHTYMLLTLGGGTTINHVLQWHREDTDSIEETFLGMDIGRAKALHAEAEKSHTAAAFPVRIQNISLGMLVLKCPSRRACSEENLAAMRIIANMLGDALSKAESERAINEMAYYDTLTNLPNRTLFNDRVEQAIKAIAKRGRQLAVLFLDVDSFKNVNDTLGHESGDLLLRLISQQLIASLRPKDTVSRFGGDEFLILINDLNSANDIPLIADRIMHLFRAPFYLEGQAFHITASAGISVYPTDGDSVDALVKNADIAMYQAKAKGKNQYVICSTTLKQEVTDRLKLTNNLYHALERGELLLYYQPQIDVKEGHMIGLEALLRWQHPQLGILPPSGFIPLAEHTGLIHPIGEWVLRTACEQSMEWQAMGLPALRMAVNISAIQFNNPEFARVVSGVLFQTGFCPKLLELELTESAALNNVEHTLQTLQDLKNLGISISIDDFGTEYSSLSRLKLLPIDRIKMDMQFVHSIGGTHKDQAVTKIIISLAKNLGLKVIAEGVETKQQFDFLAQRMCDEVQGYYYFHPMPANEMERVLRDYADASAHDSK